MQLVGIILLVIFVLFILFMRKLTKERGGPVLNGIMQVGDVLTWIRFIGGIIMILLMLLVFFALYILMKK